MALAAIVADVSLCMRRQVAQACMELSKAYLAAHQGEQAGKHLNRAIAILNFNARGNSLSKVPLHLFSVVHTEVQVLCGSA